MNTQCGLLNPSRFARYKIMLTGYFGNNEGECFIIFSLLNLNATSTKYELGRCFYYSTSTIRQRF